MIRELHINNYKSLHDITVDVARFNVLIGENGCGKSNILEAIALIAATVSNKLDNEFLVSRGIRVTSPELMRSAFNAEDTQESIIIKAGYDNSNIAITYTLKNNNQPYSKWERFVEERNSIALIEDINSISIDLVESILDKDEIKDPDLINTLNSIVEQWHQSKNKILLYLSEKHTKEYATTYFDDYSLISHQENLLKNFIIYAPENTALRNFSSEGQVEPLGIHGEGLLKLLKVIQKKSPEQITEIRKSLEVFDWYSEFEIPDGILNIEEKISITDRYLSQPFDQRSANEGFLFVLFYIALMVSDDTPKIFAIDNIDVVLNPKLCTKLIKELTRLAKKYNKQVFVTTHNPAILDGIDLGDDDQRLLVFSRNKQGHTRYKRIKLEDKPRSSSNEELKLSEAFLRGYLGGLPKGF
jgi:predicted ATPase